MDSQATSTTRRTPRAILIMLISLVVYTALDLGTKEWALEHVSRERSGEKPALCVPSAAGHTPFQRLPTQPLPLIDGVLRFSYAENCGAAFSLLRTAPAAVRLGIFGVANAVALVVLFGLFFRGSGGAGFAAAVPLIASGALGNIIDRIRHGFVVDFIQVDPKLFHYPVFNVADIWIAIGVGLLILDNARKPRAADAELENARARA